MVQFIYTFLHFTSYLKGKHFVAGNDLKSLNIWKVVGEMLQCRTAKCICQKYILESVFPKCVCQKYALESVFPSVFDKSIFKKKSVFL